MQVYLHSFLTWALDGGQWLTSRPDRFTWEITSLPTEQKAGWDPKPVWAFWRRETYLVPSSKHYLGLQVKLHNEELNGLYSLPNIVRVVKSRRMRWAGHVARMWEDRGVHRVLVGKPERKRPLGRPRRRWEDNIKMDLQGVGGGRGDWMELAQDRDGWRALVGTVRNFQVP